MAHIGFIEVYNNIAARKIQFVVRFIKKQITSITYFQEAIPRNFYKREGDDIFIKELDLTCYTSKGFFERNKLIPDDIYKMINSLFLEMSNQDRLKVIFELKTKIDGLNENRSSGNQ